MMDILKMMQKRALIVVSAVLVLPGCDMLFGSNGYFRDRGDDYLKAETATAVSLPQGVSSNSMGQLFVIPPIANPDSPMPAAFEVPKPTSMDVAVQQRNEVKIQKLGERSWIAVSSAPDAVWPRIHGFLGERGMDVARQDPAEGVIETAWLALKDDDTGRDRYRISLEQGLRSNTTEVHVLEVTVTGKTSERPVEWPAQSVNLEREKWMLTALADYLSKDDTTQASMLAQSIGSNQRRVEMVSAADPYLAMRVDFPRAWASVGGALSRDGFQIESSNKEQGQWQVNYSAARADAGKVAGEVEKPGFLRRVAMLFGFGKKKQLIADMSCQVSLQQNGEVVRVLIHDSTGKPMLTRDADNLLRIIRANLL